jgi:poly-gamma-glutamate biosynthesis protein PgsC/CapC
MTYEFVFIGLLVALLFISITGYYPGGIIVPGYLVLFIDQPLRLTGTIIASLVALLCFKIVSEYTILFGKRRFVFMILCGGVISFLLSVLLPQIFPGSIEFQVIGWVIPGLIANQYERQGILQTLSSLAIVLTALFFIGEFYLLILK